MPVDGSHQSFSGFVRLQIVQPPDLMNPDQLLIKLTGSVMSTSVGRDNSNVDISVWLDMLHSSIEIVVAK